MMLARYPQQPHRFFVPSFSLPLCEFILLALLVAPLDFYLSSLGFDRKTIIIPFSHAKATAASSFPSVSQHIQPHIKTTKADTKKDMEKEMSFNRSLPVI